MFSCRNISKGYWNMVTTRSAAEFHLVYPSVWWALIKLHADLAVWYSSHTPWKCESNLMDCYLNTVCFSQCFDPAAVQWFPQIKENKYFPLFLADNVSWRTVVKWNLKSMWQNTEMITEKRNLHLKSEATSHVIFSNIQNSHSCKAAT